MPTDPRASGASPHASHDLALIAALAADDLAPADRSAAEALRTSCAECATLAADLQVISRAVRSDLPAPRRRRDFRLTDEDARRLRGASPWRRLLERFGSPGFALLQPLGGAAAAIGLAIVVVTGGMLPFAGSAGSMPMAGAGGAAPEATQLMVTGQQSPAASAAAPGATFAAGGFSPGTAVQGSEDSGSNQEGDGRDVTERSTIETGGGAVTGVSSGVLVGAALIVAGLGVLALRWAGGRLRRLG